MFAKFPVQILERLHLPLPFGGAATLGWKEVGDGRFPSLKWRRRHACTEVAACQLHRRGWPPDVDECGEIPVGASKRIRNPTAQGGMVELPTTMPRAGFDHRRKMVPFVA